MGMRRVRGSVGEGFGERFVGGEWRAERMGLMCCWFFC